MPLGTAIRLVPRSTVVSPIPDEETAQFLRRCYWGANLRQGSPCHHHNWVITPLHMRLGDRSRLEGMLGRLIPDEDWDRCTMQAPVPRQPIVSAYVVDALPLPG